MQYKTQEPKKKFIQTNCEWCGKFKTCTWHHVGHKRYDKRYIWLCVFNGFEEGCHERVHRDPAWAYEQGLLIRHNNSYNENMKPEKKTKVCTHAKSYFDARLGYIKCQYCGKRVESINFGTHKAKNADKSDENRPKTAKMGYEQQDPRIKQAADLRNQIKSLTVAIKKSSADKGKYEALKAQKLELVSKLKGIEKSYED